MLTELGPPGSPLPCRSMATPPPRSPMVEVGRGVSTTRPICLDIVAGCGSPEATDSVSAFISSVTLDLVAPVVSSPPRLRTTKRLFEDLVPKRSARLAAKSKFRASKQDVQARKILMKKLGEDVPTEEPDVAAFDKFQVAFKQPLAPSSHEGMHVLFLGRRVHRPASVPPACRGHATVDMVV